MADALKVPTVGAEMSSDLARPGKDQPQMARMPQIGTTGAGRTEEIIHRISQMLTDAEFGQNGLDRIYRMHRMFKQHGFPTILSIL